MRPRVYTYALYAGYRWIPVIDAIPEGESEFETNWNFGPSGNWLRRILWWAKWGEVTYCGICIRMLYTSGNGRFCAARLREYWLVCVAGLYPRVQSTLGRLSSEINVKSVFTPCETRHAGFVARNYVCVRYAAVNTNIQTNKLHSRLKLQVQLETQVW